MDKNKFSFKKGINALLSGLLLSIGVSLLLAYVSNNLTVWGFWIALIGFTYWMYKADLIKRIWGRTFAGLSIESFALPLVIFIFGIKQTVRQTGTAQQIGTAIGTGIATIFIGFLAFFLGIIFVIAAYFTYKSISRPVTIEKK